MSFPVPHPSSCVCVEGGEGMLFLRFSSVCSIPPYKPLLKCWFPCGTHPDHWLRLQLSTLALTLLSLFSESHPPPTT